MVVVSATAGSLTQPGVCDQRFSKWPWAASVALEHFWALPESVEAAWPPAISSSPQGSSSGVSHRTAFGPQSPSLWIFGVPEPPTPGLAAYCASSSLGTACPAPASPGTPFLVCPSQDSSSRPAQCLTVGPALPASRTSPLPWGSPWPLPLWSNQSVGFQVQHGLARASVNTATRPGAPTSGHRRTAPALRAPRRWCCSSWWPEVSQPADLPPLRGPGP